MFSFFSTIPHVILHSLFFSYACVCRSSLYTFAIRFCFFDNFLFLASKNFFGMHIVAYLIFSLSLSAVLVVDGFFSLRKFNSTLFTLENFVRAHSYFTECNVSAISVFSFLFLFHWMEILLGVFDRVCYIFWWFIHENELHTHKCTKYIYLLLHGWNVILPPVIRCWYAEAKVKKRGQRMLNAHTHTKYIRKHSCIQQTKSEINTSLAMWTECVTRTSSNKTNANYKTTKHRRQNQNILKSDKKKLRARISSILLCT